LDALKQNKKAKTRIQKRRVHRMPEKIKKTKQF
jgi:hypothetical protein